MTNDAIEFPYRGWLIRVTFDAAGWTAQAKHPRGKNFATIQSSYAFAADAIQAAVNFVTWANPSRAMQQLLIELRDNQHLEPTGIPAPVRVLREGHAALISSQN
ncbi:hypothetical protein H6F90_12170 [Trichocoleus sp. FACHB-591]|uniref:hypothetical protein n=1 Tax=Trichocoleus sp. FACHB-591 TaxID=2692872 RepID=UPI0016828A78|nr:hypothetical protein [Trichocoleus sp. FACHB-591]MBD2095903.1 hypothetical protein [Trichocoleus sp. FACHB-591]